MPTSRFWASVSIATLMMLVVTVSSAVAQVARALELLREVLNNSLQAYTADFATLWILGIVLTGVALAAWRGHTANQAMLQISLSCLAFLYALSVIKLDVHFAFYWLQSLFGVLVVAPLVARRWIKTRLGRGSRRVWWLATCEAVGCAYLNMLLVLAGMAIEDFGLEFLS